MFDTSIVQAHAIAAPRRTTLIISLLIHTIAVVAAVGLTATSTQVPPEPPRQIELYRPAELPAAPPPPKLGRRSDPVRKQADTPPQQEQKITAPPEIPDQTPVAAEPLLPSAGPAGPADGPIGDPEGEEDGVEGGERGGQGNTPGAEGAQSGVYSPGAPGVTAARVIKRVEPRFPPNLVRAVNRATVIVLCVIGRDGRIRDPRIVHSTFPLFNDAVIEAVRQWQFEPGTLRGETVDTYFELTVRFEVTR